MQYQNQQRKDSCADTKNSPLARTVPLLIPMFRSPSLLWLTIINLKYFQRVLTHARSRVVLETLKLAAKSNKRFHVYVTQSLPDNTGKQMCDELTEAKIECTLILDSAIGYIMESIDIVLVGAEGVVESGGIINRVGTYTMALCAREMKKPFYVLAESLKFSRFYPLNQRDLPNDYKYPKHCQQKDLSRVHPLVDYTSPAYITLLFTDIGILTPSAVSDELIKLYLWNNKRRPLWQWIKWNLFFLRSKKVLSLFLVASIDICTTDACRHFHRVKKDGWMVCYINA